MADKVLVKEIVYEQPERTRGRYVEVERVFNELEPLKWARLKLDDGDVAGVRAFLWNANLNMGVSVYQGEEDNTLYIVKYPEGQRHLVPVAGRVKVTEWEYRQPPKDISFGSKYADVVAVIEEAEMQRWFGINLGDVTDVELTSIRQNFYGDKNKEEHGYGIMSRAREDENGDRWLYIYKTPLEV